jgi:[ribosomal protein S5]-alanine N-acetyltransferase
MVSQVYPTLITERLKLRPLQLKDAATMQQTLKDRDVWRYFPLSEIPSLKKTQTYIEGQLEHWAAHGFGHWALENGSHDLLGWCGLQFLPETNETEVAYCLGKPFWGKGYATEAARASLNYGTITLSIKEIIGLTHIDNIPSQNVLLKIDLRFLDRKTYFGMDCFRYKTL